MLEESTLAVNRPMMGCSTIWSCSTSTRRRTACDGSSRGGLNRGPTTELPRRAQGSEAEYVVARIVSAGCQGKHPAWQRKTVRETASGRAQIPNKRRPTGAGIMPKTILRAHPGALIIRARHQLPAAIVNGLISMVNSIYDGSRFEDIWLDQ